ncbi:hypothetical protein C8R44DRAFT_850077 [Mycena epipterygia]|nr:hypothetical protein C8R44DRAFT_850077 [Mycena epipterygia]
MPILPTTVMAAIAPAGHVHHCPVQIYTSGYHSPFFTLAVPYDYVGEAQCSTEEAATYVSSPTIYCHGASETGPLSASLSSRTHPLPTGRIYLGLQAVLQRELSHSLRCAPFNATLQFALVAFNFLGTYPAISASARVRTPEFRKKPSTGRSDHMAHASHSRSARFLPLFTDAPNVPMDEFLSAGTANGLVSGNENGYGGRLCGRHDGWK